MAGRGKRMLKGGLIRAARATGLTAMARTLTRHGFNVVGFHGVSLADEHRRFQTLFISPEAFERRLQFLTRQYRVVALADAVEQHRSGRIKPRQVVLTFDDGFFNFLGRAVPLLRKYGAPATVYVATSEVESGEPTYNLLVRDLILSTARVTIAELPFAPGQRHAVSSVREREALVRLAIGALNATCHSGPERLAFCRTVAAAAEVDIDAKLRGRFWDRLTPAEVREVAAQGFDVQLHTHTHRNVVAHPEALSDELRMNREVVEGLSGRAAVHFCYPLGLWERSVWPTLVAQGVQSAVTTRNGPNFPQTPPLALRRYLTGEAMSDLEFEFGLSGLRWLASAATGRASRFAPSEKRLRYQEQPELY